MLEIHDWIKANVNYYGNTLVIYFYLDGKKGHARYFKKDRNYWILDGIFIWDDIDDGYDKLYKKEMRKVNTMIRNHNKVRLLFLF